MKNTCLPSVINSAIKYYRINKKVFYTFCFLFGLSAVGFHGIVPCSLSAVADRNTCANIFMAAIKLH